jgi:hypothetical protein
MKPYDAVLVPGGGVRSGGILPTWAQRRLDRAIERYGAGFIIALSAGTPHRPPPIDPRGFPIFESSAAARYLTDAGVPPRRILTETHSYDTIGNAFFSRLLHVDPQGFRRLLIVTSDFHLPRTQTVFQWIYSLEPRPLAYELDFEPVIDPAMPPELWAERRRKEEAAMEVLQPLVNRIVTLRECHRWLFTEHAAYSAGGHAFERPGVDAGALASY